MARSAYLAPEALHSLGHLQADGPRPDDAHPRRQLLQVPEVRVGEVGRVLEAGDGGHGGRRSRGHHRLLVRLI